MNFAIIGCGLIGRKRCAALGHHRLVVAADICLERAAALASSSPGTDATTNWQCAVGRSDVDAVIVATTNQALAPATLAAIQAGKHVLVEKPAARSTEEILPVMAAARSTNVWVQVGFNHRYHPALRKAREICQSGAPGPLMFIRGRYGHGGRVGYQREWRADPEIAGGGELLDQGVHLIDLSRWFLGPFTEIQGCTHTYFWDMPVEDNAFLLLHTAQQQTASLHVSCTEWKNLFSLEIYGRTGKLAIDGLGGSYGVERLAWYRMLPEMGPPETTIWEYPGRDTSWELELADFEATINGRPVAAPGLDDAFAALEIVEHIYRNPHS